MRNRTKARSGFHSAYTEKLTVIPFEGKEFEAVLLQIKARVR